MTAVPVEDTQPIPAALLADDGNPLYAEIPMTTNHHEGTDEYADRAATRDREAVVLDQLADATAGSTPWAAAKTLFGGPHV